MSVTIVSNWDAAYDGLAAITAPNRQAYAQRHGYCAVEHHFPSQWGKLEALLAEWDSAEWLWWLDADAVITNQELAIEDLFSRDIVLTAEYHGLNTGSMLVRTTDTVRVLFKTIWNRRDAYNWSNGWADQNGIAYQLWKIHDHVNIIDQRRMNSYPPESGWQDVSQIWQPGDFVLHCPGQAMHTKEQILKRYL